jgi:glyoxylase-like metal-dependent hydrolase (beta-lactamase superfamily II)
MNKQILFSLLLLCQAAISFAQADKLVMSNYFKAEKILQKTTEQQGGLQKLNQPTSFRLEGTTYFFGHYDTPEKTNPVSDTQKIAFFPKLGLSYLHSSIDYRGRRNKMIMNHQDSTYYLGYFSQDFTKGKLAERTQLYLSSPAQMLLLADKNKKTLSFVGEDSEQNIVGFNDDLGNRFNLSIDKKTNRVQKITQVTYENMYGDSIDEVMYEYATPNATQPSKLLHKEHGLLESDFVYKDVKSDPKIDTAFVKYRCPTCKIQPIEAVSNLSIDNIDKQLWLISLNHLDNKVLLAEYETYIVLFEAPNNVQTCREVIALVKKKFPTKPIKYIALSHHHPDHAGGFAAFSEANAQIITTKGNIPYFQKLMQATHTLQPNNSISSAKISPQIIPQKGEFTIKDKSNEVVIYEAGEHTDHVQEFLFFYFPAQKTLFVGDLVFFPKEGIYDQRKRAYSVYKFINDKKLNIEKIYTAWPLKEQKSFGTLQDLKASLTKNYPDIK